METALGLKKQIHELLDRQSYDEARYLLDTELSKIENNVQENLWMLTEIAGGLISLGSESYERSAVELGLKLFLSHRDSLETKVTKASLDYCIGNGQHALYKIAIKGRPYQYPKPKDIDGDLFDAKASYLRAYNEIEVSKLDDFSIQVLTNLGNNLSHSGRFIEALQLFDTVLLRFPNFTQALASKANILKIVLAAAYQAPTLSLLSEIYLLSTDALKAKFVLPEIKKDLELLRAESFEVLKENNFDIDSIPYEREQNRIEYLGHSLITRFFLDNFLGLSEHGLFCKCNGAKFDDLMIGYPGYITYNPKIVVSEQVLNQLKSEFFFAKTQYYEYLMKGSDNGVHFQEIDPSIHYGLRVERLKVSFRMCFGILDKIAKGICYLFDLQIGKNENIYFESFWRKKQDTDERWNQINITNNIHLTALYSIATDMNKEKGELKFYKQWRNELEHGMLNVVDSDESDKSWETDLSLRVTEREFKAKAIHLLQITRAAIFSFAFCARTELVNVDK